MGRRVASVEAAAEGPSAEWRYRWLGRFLMASEPGSQAALISERIRDEKRRLDASDKSLADRLGELEARLASEGLLEPADRWLAALTKRRKHE